MDNFILQPSENGLWLGSFPALTAMGVEHGFSTRFGGCGGTDGQTLDLGWELLATLPRNALDRCDAATLDKYYEPAKARIEKDKR